jgi:Lon protease-like protein
VSTNGERPELLARVERACGRLKVFPLPGVVVFPGTPTPLHVFEPRYRALVADALDSDGVLAVPTIGDPEGPEPVTLLPVAGAGVIEAHEQLADGRYHIVVRGVARVRLVAEVPSGKLYREFRAAVLADEGDAGGEALAARREAVEQLLVQIAAGLPAATGAPRLAADATKLAPSPLADLAAAALVTDADARYAILSELDVARRLDLVIEEAAAVVLALTARSGPKV